MSPRVQPIRPKPDTIPVIRANKEALTRAQISVRDQAIRRTIDVLARERNKKAHEITRPINSYFRTSSLAHARGAFDVSVRGASNPSHEASEISHELGRGFLVIHEKPAPDGKQTNDYYREGRLLKSETKRHGSPGFHADGPHIHVQPDREVAGGW